MQDFFSRRRALLKSGGGIAGYNRDPSRLGKASR